MFRLGSRKWVSLIESHATCYRANQAVLSVPDTLQAGAGGGPRLYVLFPLPCTCRGRKQLGGVDP